MKEDPIFKSIFGDDWDKLPPVMHKHYANRPFTSDITKVDGTLDVKCAGPIKALSWLFWLMQGIPPHSETEVPVTVNFESDKETKFFYFNRIFNFKTRKAYNFKSRMIQTTGNEVIEIMRSRIGWRMNYEWEDEKVKLKHKGYVLYVFGHFIPLPLTFLLGEGNAEELAIDENTFDMVVTIFHPWWGTIYEYKGRFSIRNNND